MSRKIQIKRTTVPGRLPTDLGDGELALNLPDERLIAGDSTGDIDLSPVRFHSVDAAYLAGDIVLYSSGFYEANQDIPAPEAFNLLKWEPVTSPVGTGTTFNYEWATSTSGDPGSGAVSVNNADPALATMVLISRETSNGNDVGFIFDTLQEGDFIGFQEGSGNQEYAYYVIAGAIVDNGTWYSMVAVAAATSGSPENGRSGILSLVIDPNNRLPVGGDNLNVLTKASDTNYDTQWDLPSPFLRVAQVAHGFTADNLGAPVYFDGADWLLAQADVADTLGVSVIREVVDVDNFVIQSSGAIPVVSDVVNGGVALVPGEFYFVSEATAGQVTITEPTGLTEFSNPIFLAISTELAIVLPWRASGVSDYVHEQSPVLVEEQDLAGINLNTNPFTWDLEEGHNYQINITDIVGWVGLSATTYLQLRVEDSGGVLIGSSDYRWGGIRASSDTGLVNINGYLGGNKWLLCGLAADGEGISSESRVDLTVEGLKANRTAMQARNRSYRYDGDAHCLEQWGGHMNVPGDADLTKGHLTCDTSGVIPRGRIQVYRLPKIEA